MRILAEGLAVAVGEDISIDVGMSERKFHE